ncbi:restriction endonuclease subunit S [Lutispora saccharofermentans]|uniref:Restriction endonuclease subunit S n=1 Tax=Lutispora saccharofermentans TaxID=3024236 RepID=A0ABT1NIX0_9FIRM|nr:restriction endonuclease subunit S [Lutispora saccharofermentans]MCQ1530241.1 restriction endonuclease subunit S [Lutispora saccharofermentans]
MSKWKLVKLGEVCEFIRNGASIKQGKNRNGYPITRIETISNCIVDRNKMGYAGIGELGKYKEYVLNSGDILMSHINSEKHLGKVAYYENRNEETIIHGMNLLCLRLKQQKVRYKYVFYFLNSSFFRRQIPNITKKSVNQASFTVTALKELIMILPPLDIQKHIANTLDKTQEIIDGHKKQLEELDNLIKATFYDMFGDPVTNEKGWKIYKLKNIINGTPQNGLYKPASEYVNDGTGIPILRIDAFYNGKITNISKLKRLNCIAEEIDKYKLKENDIVINRVNSIEYLGKSALIKGLGEDTVFESNMMRFSVDDTIINVNFLIEQLCSTYIYMQVLGHAKKSVNQASINQKDVQDLDIIVPPLDLQNKFAKIITNIEQQKSLVKQSITESQNLFNGLMSKYFD